MVGSADLSAKFVSAPRVFQQPESIYAFKKTI
jgi:hypothetical protein